MKNLALVLVCLSALGASSVAQTSTTPAKPKTAPSATTKKAPATAARKPGTAAKGTGSKVTLDTQQKKASYAMGMNLGHNLHSQKIDVNTDALIQGLRDGISGGPTAMTEADAQKALEEFRNEMRTKFQAEAAKEAAGNKAEGSKFLAENKSKPGVTTLPDGLQYKVITQGTGPKPAATDTVACNYKGSLVNGQEFDSSYKHGDKPVEFPVNQVIKGWTEALQLMPVGSKWQLFIPSDMAYGDSGRPGIPPGSTLVFEVELVSIKDKNSK